MTSAIETFTIGADAESRSNLWPVGDVVGELYAVAQTCDRQGAVVPPRTREKIAPMNGTDCQREASHPSTPLSRCLIIALQLAVIGSTCLALCESLSAALVSAKHFDNGRWPLHLIAAAFGKAAVTHTLLWTPLLMVAALAIFTIRKGRIRSTPIPVLFAVFVVLVAVVVVPADLELGTKLSRSTILVASGAFAMFGLLFVLPIRMLVRRSSEKSVLRMMRSCTVLAALVTSGTAVAFVRSPFFDPGGYRVPLRNVAAPSREVPHVLWIVIDTVRADRMSCYGYGKTTTPFLNTWAERSIVFEKAIGNGMWTVPSHASMFTGLSVRQHGLGRDRTRLDDKFTTVAEVLSENGYVTASFSNNPWISRDSGLAAGFETARVVYYLRHLNRFSLEHALESWGMTPPVSWFDRDFGGAMTNYMINEWLDIYANGNAPLFLYVNYMEAHLPYAVPESYQRMFMTDDQVERSFQLREHAFGPIVDAMDKRFNLEGGSFLNRRDREILKLQYESGIRYVDERVRELIGMFEQRGMLKNTLVVIASDHGEYLDTHGMWSHRFLAYNDLTHVALMIREPGRTAPLRIATPVQPSDLFSTILQFAGSMFDRPSPYVSRDLLAVAERGGEDRIVISECGGPIKWFRDRIKNINDPVISHLATPQVTAQDGRFKYMASGDGMVELFDLTTDPNETRNVYADYPAEVDRLTAYIREWMENVPPYAPSDSDTHEDAAPDFIEALRSLGYLGD